MAFLQKTTSEFTKADIISFIQQKDIRMVNFMYPAGDGRLKTLNFVINNQAYLEAILTWDVYKRQSYNNEREALYVRNKHT